MKSSLATQRRLIATSSLITFGVGMYGAYARDEMPTARFLIGMGFAYTVCSAFADFGSGLGAGFAVLIMIAAILYQGEDVLKQLQKRGAKRQGKGKRAKAKSKAGRKPVGTQGRPEKPDEFDDPGDYPH